MAMIKINPQHGHSLRELNTAVIESVDLSGQDTVITLTNGKKIKVWEAKDNLVKRINKA